MFLYNNTYLFAYICVLCLPTFVHICMCFLRKLKRAKFPCHVLVNFSRRTIERVLTGNITNRYFMSAPGQEGSATGDWNHPEQHRYPPRAARLLNSPTLHHENSLLFRLIHSSVYRIFVLWVSEGQQLAFTPTSLGECCDVTWCRLCEWMLLMWPI